MTKQKTISRIQQKRLELLRNHLRGVDGIESDLRDVLLDLLDTGRIHPLARRRTLHGVSGAHQLRVPAAERDQLMERVKQPIQRTVLALLLSGGLGIVPVTDDGKRLTFCGTKSIGRSKPSIPGGDDFVLAIKQGYVERVLMKSLGASGSVDCNGCMDLQIGGERLAVLICEDGQDPDCSTPGIDSAQILVFVRVTVPSEPIEFLGWGRRGDDVETVSSRSIEDLQSAARTAGVARMQ